MLTLISAQRFPSVLGISPGILNFEALKSSSTSAFTSLANILAVP